MIQLSIVEIGGDIEPGDYGIKVNSNGTQAKTNINVVPDGSVITREQAGIVSINGLEINISEGMTGTEVNERIRDAAGKVGVDVDMTTGEVSTVEYGLNQYIKMDASSDELKGLLGVDGTEYNGTDASVDFGTDGGKRVGFSDTATITADGNRITVTDKNGFKMVYDVDPESGPVDNINVKVLSAGPMVLQIGNNEGQTFNVNINKTTAEALEINHINVYTHEYALMQLKK